MSDADLNKLKVTELKEELKKRGIDTKGNKAQLIQKLKKALKEERNEGGTDDSEGAGDVSFEGGDSSAVMDSSQYDSVLESSQNESTLDPSLSKPEEKLIEEKPVDRSLGVEISAHFTSHPESSALFVNKDILGAELPKSTETAKPEKVVSTTLKPEALLELDTVEQLVVEEPKAELAVTQEPAVRQPDAKEQKLEEQTPEEQPNEEPAAESVFVAKSSVEEVSEEAAMPEETPMEIKVEDKSEVEVMKVQQVAETVEPEKQTTDVDPEGIKEKPVELAEKKDVELLAMEEGSVVLVEDGKASEMEAEEKPDVDMEIIESSDSVKERRGEKRRRSRTRSRSHSPDKHRSWRSRSKSPKRGRHSRSRSRSKTRSRSRSQDRSHSRERRHYRSRSVSQEKQQRQSRSPDKSVIEVPENEDWLTSTVVQVDRYNSDMSVIVDEAGLKVTPLSRGGFAYMWHGIKSTYGVNKGKAGYEVKILEHLDVDLPPEELNPHVVRVGFSTDAASTRLGEEKFSYGYGGTGKASTDCKFTNYGTTFGAGDVIGAFVDFESDPVIISYTKNGEDLGTCFEIPTDSLEGCALFPHVLTKNCSFECNFGQLEESFFPVKEGFTFLNVIPEEDRVRGSLPPVKKEDCEMIMMCGLPGSGKTCWAAKHSEANPDKRYNILGTNSIIDKMKVMGLPRKRNYHGRWDVLIDLSTKCLNHLLTVAARKKRNYILDQTNVYPSAQRRKMRPFEGFQRTAVVIVPTDEEFKRRCEQREKEEGKEIPDSAVLEMKANFQLPTEGFIFDKVQFVELQKEEAQALVDQYNQEGKQSSGGRHYRGNDRNQSYDNRSNRSYGSYGSGQDRGRDNQRSWGYNNRRGGGGGGGGVGGGYYNRDNRDSGGYGNRRGGGREGGYGGSGGYSGGGGGGGYGGGGYRRNDRGSSGGGYNQPDRRRDQSSWSSSGYRDRRDNRGGSSGERDSSWGGNRSSGYQPQQHSSWKSQGNQGSNRNTYGQSQQGSWSGQGSGSQTGSWGASNTAASGWGGAQQDWSQQTGYQQPTWGQWTPYNQQSQQQQQLQQQPQQQQQQQPQATAAWNQQYWNSWNAYSQAQPGGWDYSQYNAQGGAQK